MTALLLLVAALGIAVLVAMDEVKVQAARVRAVVSR